MVGPAGLESTPVWSGVQISSENRSTAEIQIKLEAKLQQFLLPEAG